MIGGDFNEIKNNEGKREGKRRQESNFSDFWNFILDMEMGDIRFRGELSHGQIIKKEKGSITRYWTNSLVQQSGCCSLTKQK